MNARVQVIVATTALIAIAGVFAFRSRPASLSETKPQAVGVATTPVAQVAQEQLNDATKQAIAVQNAAASAVPDVKPVNEGYSFLTNSEELVLNYRVNFDPTKDVEKAQETAQKLAKSWRIKELEAYQPKTVKIVLVHVTDRKKKEFGFTPSGEAL
jgi:predicted lipid-binding transport protein (Tim44 family)